MYDLELAGTILPLLNLYYYYYYISVLSFHYYMLRLYYLSRFWTRAKRPAYNLLSCSYLLSSSSLLRVFGLLRKVLYKLFFDAPVAFSAAAAAAAAMMGQPPAIHAAPAMPAMPAMQPGMQFGMIPPQPNPHAAAAMAAMFAGQPHQLAPPPAMAMPVAGPFGMFGAIPRFR